MRERGRQKDCERARETERVGMKYEKYKHKITSREKRERQRLKAKKRIEKQTEL